jgi:hypothetical protein
MLQQSKMLPCSNPDGCLRAAPCRCAVALRLQVKYFKGSFQDPTQFFAVPMVNAAARELARHAIASNPGAVASGLGLGSGGEVLQWAPRLAKFPHPSLQSTSLLGQVLSSFIFASLMFGFVTQVRNDGGGCSFIHSSIHVRPRDTGAGSKGGAAAISGALLLCLVRVAVVSWARC